MNEIVKYQCEFCGTIYSSESACQACENNHKTQGQVVGYTYQSINEEKDGYPTSILVQFKENDSNQFVEYIKSKSITKKIAATSVDTVSNINLGD